MEGPNKPYKFKNVRSITVIGDLIIDEYDEVDIISDDHDLEDVGTEGTPQTGSPRRTKEVQRHSPIDPDHQDLESTAEGGAPTADPDGTFTDKSVNQEPRSRGSEPTPPQPLIIDSKDSSLSEAQMESILAIRFGNRLLDVSWNKESISSVLISRKEKTLQPSNQDMGMMMSHLLHLMTLVCTDSIIENIPDARLKVLQCIQPPTADDMVLGQVQRGDSQQHLDYAAVAFVLKDTGLWDGVPFILRSGTGMDEFKEEIRIQLKPSQHFAELNDQLHVRNEIILRLKPEPRFYMKLLVKPIGSGSIRRVDVPLYCARDQPDDSVSSSQDNIPFTDVEVAELKRILEPLNRPVIIHNYPEGTQGPTEADMLCEQKGYLHKPSW